MNPTSTPRPDVERPAADLRGWLVLTWVAAWSVAYFHYTLATRFPWLKAWLGWFS